MFPELTEQQINQVEKQIEKEQNAATTFNGKSFLYDFKKGDFVRRNGKFVEVRGRDALKVWIEKVIRTHRFRFKIYKDTEYGVLIEDLIGTTLPRGFVQSELKRELTEAILINELIESLTEWEIEHDGDRLTIRFTVISVYGPFDMEVEEVV